MSWHFSQALVEEYLELTHLGSRQCVQLSGSNTQLKYSAKDRMTGYSLGSRFGMMCAALMADRGEDLLTWYREDFLAKHSQQQPEAETLPPIFGLKCKELFQKFLHNSCWWKTWQEPRKPCKKPAMTYNLWGFKLRECSLSVQKTSGPTTNAYDFGLLATPTTAGNQLSQSMRKHRGCKNLQQLVSELGLPFIRCQEWMMGFPQGWTDKKPLGTDKFQEWQQQHFLKELGD